VKVFVSSTYLDLREHRAAAIGVLRQLGHEVLAMEDMVAGTSPPLEKVLDMVDRAEAYVGIFAWRYGSVPDAPPPHRVAGAARDTSITHYEYLRAKERGIPALAFLLQEGEPWSPALIDGVANEGPGSPRTSTGERIRALRRELMREKVVAFFTTPDSLEGRVATAVTTLGLGRQIDLQAAVDVDSGAASGPVMDSGGSRIAAAVGEATMSQQVFRIDLADDWWHTRLYLLAALAERLTRARRVLVVTRRLPEDDARRFAFVGLLGTRIILATLRPTLPQFADFDARLATRVAPDSEPRAAADEILHQSWIPAFLNPADPAPDAGERAVQVSVTPDRLQRWFGDAMLQQAVEIADVQAASVVDLLRLVDYPSSLVPILHGRDPGEAGAFGEVDVLDKAALNARLAHSYLTELKERARIA
jgi:hypothetical protein